MNLIRRYKKLKKGMVVVIIPSYVCNFSCSYCIRDVMEMDRKPDLGLEKWKEFLADLDENLRQGGTKIKEIILSGGEPTLLPYFVELSEWILKRWFLTVYTNLSNLQTLKIKNRKLFVVASYHSSQMSGDVFLKRAKRLPNVKIKEIGGNTLDIPVQELRTKKYKMKYFGQLTVDADFKMSIYNLC